MTADVHWDASARRAVGEARLEQAGHTYEVRPVARHPLLTTYGRDVRLVVP